MLDDDDGGVKAKAYAKSTFCCIRTADDRKDSAPENLIFL